MFRRKDHWIANIEGSMNTGSFFFSLVNNNKLYMHYSLHGDTSKFSTYYYDQETAARLLPDSGYFIRSEKFLENGELFLFDDNGNDYGKIYNESFYRKDTDMIYPYKYESNNRTDSSSTYLSNPPPYLPEEKVQSAPFTGEVLEIGEFLLIHLRHGLILEYVVYISKLKRRWWIYDTTKIYFDFHSGTYHDGRLMGDHHLLQIMIGKDEISGSILRQSFGIIKS